MTRFCLIASALLLTACAGATGIDQEAQYTKSVRALSLIPVYPPREDLQVGDIYFVSQGNRDNPDDRVRFYIDTSREVVNAAQSHLQTRLVFRPTHEASKISATDATRQQPDIYSGRVRFRGDRGLAIESLPVVAFPEITLDRGSSQAIGIARVFNALGLARGERTVITLNFNDTRRFGAPRSSVIPISRVAADRGYCRYHQSLGSKADQTIADQVAREVLRYRDSLRARDSSIAGVSLENRSSQVAIVTETILTRKITFTFRNAEIVAAGLRRAARTQVDDPSAAKVNAPSSVVVNVGASAPAGAVTDAEIQAVRNSLNSVLQGTVQGEGLNFESWDGRGLSFSQYFERPVVVAWDGFEFDLPSVCGGVQQTLATTPVNVEERPGSDVGVLGAPGVGGFSNGVDFQ